MKFSTALCRLLAPILVFTAEEAWRYSAVAGIADAGQSGLFLPATTSVHLQEFPFGNPAQLDSRSETIKWLKPCKCVESFIGKSKKRAARS